MTDIEPGYSPVAGKISFIKQTDPAGDLATVMGNNGSASLILGKNSVVASITRG